MIDLGPNFKRYFAVILAGLALICAGCGASKHTASSASSSSNTADTSDEQAAAGPLVGDPELIDGEQSCQRSHPNPPWFTTIAAFEVYDSARTHLYGCAHFLGSMTAANRVLAYESTDVYQTPYNIVSEGPNRLFIYGGGYGDNASASGSFVASVEPATLNERWRRVLINTNATNEWDYPGVLNVMKDGSLIVIYGYHIARINPATGAIGASTTL